MTKNVQGAVLSRFPLPEDFFREADRFQTLLQKSGRVLISSTLTSDGDSIGAQLGIYHLIRSLLPKSPEITIINESPVPKRYSFLKGADRITSYQDWIKTSAQQKFDLGIVLDGGIERTGVVKELFDAIPASVLIDHHAVGSRLNYESRLLDTKASSTCEIVYHLYEYFGQKVDRDIAAILYVGVIFDTGFFKHSLTTPRTHAVASELIATGIDFSELADRAILERSWSGQMLLQKLLLHMERSASGRLVSSYWTRAELDEIQFQDGDQEGMINQMYYTDTARVVALFVESGDGQVKISFRSKGEVNVADFARSLNPEGGGHIRAAGCTLQGDLQTVRKQVLAKLESLLAQSA